VVSEDRFILIVEDDGDSRIALRVLLEVWGYRVEEAACGEQAIAIALARQPDLILLDLGLPDLDGYQVAHRLRRVDGYRPFLIALTGLGLAEDRGRARDAGFDAHLVKPVEPDALQALLVRGGATRRGSRRADPPRRREDVA